MTRQPSTFRFSILFMGELIPTAHIAEIPFYRIELVQALYPPAIKSMERKTYLPTTESAPLSAFANIFAVLFLSSLTGLFLAPSTSPVSNDLC